MLGFKWIYEQSKLLQQCAMAQRQGMICLKVNCRRKVEYSCEQQIYKSNLFKRFLNEDTKKCILVLVNSLAFYNSHSDCFIL